MTTPGRDPLKERLDELEENIERARRQAQEHGTLPTHHHEHTFIDPDGDDEVDDEDEHPGTTFAT